MPVKFVENLYYHELAKDLHRFGYSIRNNPRGDFELQGISQELCQRFSKRHQQINEATEALLAARPELARGNRKDLRERVATSSRARKSQTLPHDELRTVWNAELSTEE